MKGVILAGGLGTRLDPLTRVTNKHLLPVYDRPMIYYPLQSLVGAGIRDILIVTGGNNAGDFLQLLGNGEEFGLKHLNYTYQHGEGGIADALKLARHFCGSERFCVYLGDNYLEQSIRPAVERFTQTTSSAMILLKSVPDARRFGVAEIVAGEPYRIVEKPKHPPSDLAVVGVYFYDSSVFEVINELRPSERGELEITDVNNWYIDRDQMRHMIIEGYWSDMGLPESIYRTASFVRTSRHIDDQGEGDDD